MLSLLIAAVTALPLGAYLCPECVARVSLCATLLVLVNEAASSSRPSPRLVPDVFVRLLVCALGYLAYVWLPELAVDAYTALLGWSDVLFALFEALQVVRILRFVGRILVLQIDRYEAAAKGGILALAFAGFVGAGVLFYRCYTQPDLDPAFSGVLSSVVTVLVLITASTIVLPTGIVSDPALVSLYVAFLLYQACLWKSSQAPAVASQSIFVQLGFLQSIDDWLGLGALVGHSPVAIQAASVMTLDLVLSIVWKVVLIASAAVPFEAILDKQGATSPFSSQHDGDSDLSDVQALAARCMLLLVLMMSVTTSILQSLGVLVAHASLGWATLYVVVALVLYALAVHDDEKNRPFV